MVFSGVFLWLWRSARADQYPSYIVWRSLSHCEEEDLRVLRRMSCRLWGGGVAGFFMIIKISKSWSKVIKKFQAEWLNNNATCDMWGVVWHVSCNVTCDLTCDMWHIFWHVMYDLLCDMWYDMWHNIWQDIWHLTRHLICDMTCDMWPNMCHVTYDMICGTNYDMWHGSWPVT